MNTDSHDYSHASVAHPQHLALCPDYTEFYGNRVTNKLAVPSCLHDDTCTSGCALLELFQSGEMLHIDILIIVPRHVIYCKAASGRSGSRSFSLFLLPALIPCTPSLRAFHACHASIEVRSRCKMAISSISEDDTFFCQPASGARSFGRSSGALSCVCEGSSNKQCTCHTSVLS